MAVPSCSWERYNHYLAHSDYVENQRNFVYQNAKPLRLDTAKTLISVGAGNGLLDEYIVRKCTPQLEHYIGVDPHEPSCDALGKSMESFTNMKITIVNEGIPGWKGPERPVDVVLLMNVLYYTPDRMAVVRQCYSWLKLGGSLLIFHSLYDNTFVMIATEIETRLMKRYAMEDVKAELKREGFSWHDEGTMDTHVKLSNSSDQMVKLYFRCLAQDFPDDLMMKLMETFRRTCKNQEATIENECIRLEKPCL